MYKLFIYAIGVILLLNACTGLASITEEQRTKIFIEDHPLKKDKAYDVSFEWIAKNFNSANNVIQMKDKENGTLILQGLGSYYYDILQTVKINFDFTLTIKIKDEKIKLEFITNGIEGTGNLPQAKDIESVYNTYNRIHGGILTALKNYKQDDF